MAARRKAQHAVAVTVAALLALALGIHKLAVLDGDPCSYSPGLDVAAKYVAIASVSMALLFWLLPPVLRLIGVAARTVVARLRAVGRACFAKVASVASGGRNKPDNTPDEDEAARAALTIGRHFYETGFTTAKGWSKAVIDSVGKDSAALIWPYLLDVWVTLQHNHEQQEDAQGCVKKGTGLSLRGTGGMTMWQALPKWKRLATIAGIVLFAYFIWPTPYFYVHVAGGSIVRVNRITGNAKRVWPGVPTYRIQRNPSRY